MMTNDISKESSGRALPSNIALIGSTLLAILFAAVILLVAIFPAEYGYDPTGAGKALGLTVLSSDQALDGLGNEVASAESGTLPAGIQRQGALSTQTVKITVLPHRGTELKALMDADQSVVYEWKTDQGTVSFDMHGERENAKEGEFTSYQVGVGSSFSQGLLNAPFKGTHGWYWENNSDQPITIELTISGFYQGLFQP